MRQVGNPDPIEAALAKQLGRRLDGMRPIGLRLYQIAWKREGLSLSTGAGRWQHRRVERCRPASRRAAAPGHRG